MKRSILLTCCCVLYFFSSFAQSNKEDIDLIQAIYGKEKKSIVGNFIKPPDAKKATFWTLYDAYETERKSLGQKRIALLEQYAKIYGSTDDNATDNVMKQTMELQKKVDGIIATYYEKIRTAIGVNQAAQFYQLESYLLSATRMYILGNIPFIDELEKAQPPKPAGK